MQAVTIRPEWAFAIAALGCRILSKDYQPEALLGSGRRVALHAGKHVGGRPGRPAALRGLTELAHAAALYRLHGVVLLPYEDSDDARIAVRKVAEPEGVIIGADELPRDHVFAVAELDTPCGLREYTWAIPGREHWRLNNFHLLGEPVPCAGHGGIWTLPAEVAARVAEQDDTTRTTLCKDTTKPTTGGAS
jgi:hypothetical protein